MALVDNFNKQVEAETFTFPLRVGEMTVTLRDVAALLGLRINGPAVTMSNDRSWAGECMRLLGVAPSG